MDRGVTFEVIAWPSGQVHRTQALVFLVSKGVGSSSGHDILLNQNLGGYKLCPFECSESGSFELTRNPCHLHCPGHDSTSYHCLVPVSTLHRHRSTRPLGGGLSQLWRRGPKDLQLQCTLPRASLRALVKWKGLTRTGPASYLPFSDTPTSWLC